MLGLGFRVEGLKGFRVWGLGFRALGLGVQGSSNGSVSEGRGTDCVCVPEQCSIV